MITAIAWDNTRAFNKWIESVRLLQQSHGNDPGVILTFLENLPTPMYSANLTTETGGARELCCSYPRVDSCSTGDDNSENAAAKLNAWP